MRNRSACPQLPAIVATTSIVRTSLRSRGPLLIFSLAILLVMQMTAAAQTWQTLVNPPPVPEIIDPQYDYDLGPGGASNPILLTDGSVIIQNANPYAADGEIFKLTPDINGSYLRKLSEWHLDATGDHALCRGRSLASRAAQRRSSH